MSWNSVKIKDVALQVRGISYSPSDVSPTAAEGYIPILRANNITDAGLTFDDVVHISARCVTPKQFLRQGDIVVATSSGSKNIIGKAGYNGETRQVSFGAFCKVIRPKQGIYPEYLGYYFRSPKYRATISHLSAGANINNIRNEHIDDLDIPLPPLDVQRQIADTLHKADALRRKDQELLQKYDELAQSIFYELFGDSVRNEKGWPTEKIGGLAKVSSGSTPSRDKSEYFGGSIPWVKTTEVRGTRIFGTEEKLTSLGLNNSSCRVFEPKSVIVAMYGQGKTRGQVGILECAAATNQACAVVLPCPDLEPNFLYYLLKLSYGQLRELGRGGNQQNLNLGMVRDFTIIVPDLPHQEMFAQALHKLESSIALNEQAALRTGQLFNSLMTTYYG